MHGTHMMLRDALPGPMGWALILVGFAAFVALEVTWSRVGAQAIGKALVHGWRSATAFTDSLLWQRIGVLVAAVCVTVFLMLLAHVTRGTY